MAVVKMKRLEVLALASERLALMSALARAGVVDIRADQALQACVTETQEATSAELSEEALDEIFRSIVEGNGQQSGLNQAMLKRLEQEVLTRQSMLKDGISAVDRYVEDKPFMNVRRDVPLSEFYRYADLQRPAFAELQSLFDAQRRLQQLQTERAHLETKLKLYAPWSALELQTGLNLKRDFVKQSRFDFLIASYRLPKAGDGALFAALDEAYSAYYVAQRLQTEEEQVIYAFAVEESKAPAFERSLRGLGLGLIPALPNEEAQSYQEAYEGLQTQSASRKAEEESSKLLVRESAVHQKNWQGLFDYYLLALEKIRALQNCVNTGRLLAFKGYVPATLAESVRQVLQERFACQVSLLELAEGEEAPVALKNKKWAQPYESVIEMFSLPQPGVDIDPTPILTPFYALLFGMMLGDVGYGLLLVLGTAYLLYKVKVEGKMAQMCRLLFQGGLTSIFFGFLFGGFFGNAVTAISGESLHFPTLWFDPIKEPLTMMAAGILFGALHLFAGMGIQMYLYWRSGLVTHALFKVLPWYFILIGAGLYGGLQMEWAKYLLFVGIVVLLLFSAVGQRNPIKRLFSGLGALYGITGYISDLLSYSRILALALATSVIAMVVNILATMGGFSVLGVVLFLVVMPFGHLLNLALSGLSAYVHTTRLQYVEFFGKFYTGGGLAFVPLSEQRTKYIRLQADEKVA